MTTEYIIASSRSSGALSRYDPAYCQVRRIALLIEGMHRRAIIEGKEQELERRSYRISTKAEAGK